MKVDRMPPEWMVGTIRSNPGQWKVCELCQKHVDEHGWSVDLALAFRKWISTLGTWQTDNLCRAKAEWFLWFEDVLPIKLETCWGERVRRDLRAMKAEERKAWIGLLGQAAFTIMEKPTKKWFKPAEAAFPKIGAAAFRRRFTEWFASFGTGEPLRLTVTGRNVLRLLIWAVLIAKDPAVDEALAEFAGARWKTKDSENKAAQAEMAFSYVLAERTPEKALPILEEMVQTRRARPGSASYRIFRAPAAIINRVRLRCEAASSRSAYCLPREAPAAPGHSSPNRRSARTRTCGRRRCGTTISPERRTLPPVPANCETPDPTAPGGRCAKKQLEVPDRERDRAGAEPAPEPPRSQASASPRDRRPPDAAARGLRPNSPDPR